MSKIKALIIFGVVLALLLGITQENYDKTADLPTTEEESYFPGLFFLNLFNIDAHLYSPFSALATHQGYLSDTHEVETEDGYILQLFRLQGKNQTTFDNNRPVILLMHPLHSNSDIFIMNHDQTRAPGLRLANEGYDVWIGNVRGGRYSRKHKTLDSDKDIEFWMFTWQHHAKYDLPAIVQYIANYTGKKMDYLGHSQGALMILAALAEKSNIVEEHINKIIALAPSVYAGRSQAPFVSWLLTGGWFQHVYDYLGIRRFFGFHEPINMLAGKLCSYIPSICKGVIYYCSPEEYDLIDENLFPRLAGHLPSGSSMLNMLHYAQMFSMKEPKLQMFNYGNEGNLKAYGQETAPYYNLTNILKKVHVFVGTKDSIVHNDDADQLARDLPNAEVRKYPMGHCAFMFAKNLSYFDDVLQVLKETVSASPLSI